MSGTLGEARDHPRRSTRIDFMRFVLLVLSCGAAISAHAQFLTFDRKTVEKAGAKEIQLPGVPEEPYTSLPLPGAGLVRFSIPLTRQDVPPGWSFWQKDVTPKILESPDGLSVTLFFSPPAAAFGAELMPVWKKGRDMKMEIVDSKGQSITRFVKFDPGAQFFGFTQGKVKAVRFSKMPFDEGSFGIGRMLYSPHK